MPGKGRMLEERIKEIIEPLFWRMSRVFDPDNETYLAVLTARVSVLFSEWAKEQNYVKVAPDQTLPEPKLYGFDTQFAMLTPHDNGDGTESLFMRVIRKKGG